MIEPPPPAIMRGKAARLSRNEPVRLTASTRSQSARLVSRTVPLGSYGAAPLTRISNRPKASCAAATAARLSPSTATTQRRAIARSPAFWTRRAVSSADRRSMSQHATAAPTSTNAREIARPIPPPAPLTRATLPVSVIGRRLRWSEHHRSAINGDGLAGNKTTRIRDEPGHRSNEVGWGQIALDRLPALDHLERSLGLVAKEFARAIGQHCARAKALTRIRSRPSSRARPRVKPI